MVYFPSQEHLTEDSPICPEDYLQKNLPVTPLFQILKDRIEIEKKVLSSKSWDGIVLRPPMVYGGKKGHATIFFQQAEEKGKLTLFGDGNTVFSYIHIHDLAEAYARVVEADASVVAGQVLHFAEAERLTQKEVAVHFAKTVGKENLEIEFAPWFNPMFETSTFWLDSSKAKRLLGWTPGHNLLRDAKVLYLAWKETGAPGTW